MGVTLPETNIAPENGWLEDYFPFGMAYFQGLWLLVLERVIISSTLDLSRRKPANCALGIGTRFNLGQFMDKVREISNLKHIKNRSDSSWYASSCNSM